MPGNSSITPRDTLLRTALIVGVSLIAAAAAHAQVGSIIVVTTTSDDPRARGACKLRNAIIAANTNAPSGDCGAGTGEDAIYFSLGAGNPEIDVGAVSFPFTPEPLPAITEKVAIEGATGGATRVVLHGPGTSSGVGPGLSIAGTAFGTTIRNLVINNFQGDGITSQAQAVTVAGDFIGTDATGAAAQPNTGAGVFTPGNGQIGGTNGTTPGGSCTGDCNLISGNGTAGIWISGFGSEVIEGNLIGTNAAGNGAIPNSVGILLSEANGDTVGDGTAAGRNVISGNSGNGVELAGSSSVHVFRNYIGTASDGTTALPNGGDGVLLRFDGAAVATFNSIGSPSFGNVIAFNATGVRIVGVSSALNTLSGNSIHDNVGLGIVNERNGAETAPPTILQAKTSISGTACNACLIDVFADAQDEGRTFLGRITANGSGAWVTNQAAPGPHITATATDTSNGTSNFSAPFSCPDFNNNGLCDGVDDIDHDFVVDALDDCIIDANTDQYDADGDGYGNLCDADLNNSGLVTVTDYTILRNALNSTNPVADLNHSGRVTVADYTILRNRLNTAPGPSGLHEP